MRQPLQARGPFHRAQAALDGVVIAPILVGMAQRGNRSCRVFDLVTADQFGQRQVEQTIHILIDHAAMFLMGEEILPEGDQRRAKRIGAARDDIARNVVLRTHDDGHARLDDARFLRRDIGNRGAEKFLRDRVPPA